MTEDLKKRKVTVLGLGRSGIAAATYLRSKGADVFLSDSAEATPEKLAQAKELEAKGVKVELGKHSPEALKFGDFIVTSPGIKPNSDVILEADRLGKEVICDIELAYRCEKIPIIAVTGTNGKSTTTALISFILSKSGRKAPACGNIGNAIFNEVPKKPDFLVVEISSFQLHYSRLLAPQVAVWMNLTPDHLDWHDGLTNYITAKNKLFANQQRNQFAVLNMDDHLVKSAETQAELFPFAVTSDISHCMQGAFIKDDYLIYRVENQSHVLCHKDELQIIGKHNLENALAAISACALVGVSADDIDSYLKEFKALEHRLEFVATVDGVRYYNDSKATNTDSAIKALEAFPDEKVVLIAGGKDKGTPLGDFVLSVRNHASAVILIGEAKSRFETAMREGGVENIHMAKSLEEAVALGGKLKQGPVLLSPACASFDMFKDFEDRGRVFKDIVRARQVAPSA